MWILIISLITISLAIFLEKRYSYTYFFRFMRRYRGWILILVAILFYMIEAAIYGVQSFLNVFVIVLIVGIFYCVKDKKDRS